MRDVYEALERYLRCNSLDNLTQFSALVALWVGGLALFAFMFQRLENRIDKRMDRLEDKVEAQFGSIDGKIGGLEGTFDNQIGGLRHDLAEEFRAQRAEVAAQVAAIAGAINASRRP